MVTHNPKNERIKRRYFAFLKEAKRHSEATVDGVAQSLARFEAQTRYRDFQAFHYEQASAFKRHLAEENGKASGQKLSKATLNSTLANLKRFFQWLSGQSGYKSGFSYSDAEYFNLSANDARVATTRREKPFPTLAQVKHVVAAMPRTTDIERRNRAIIAFTLLTGARDSAIASMSLKHVDLTARKVYQDGREVKTKFSKTFETFFFQVGDEIEQVVVGWVKYLRDDKLFGNDDPLFPATQVALDAEQRFRAIGLGRRHWSNATAIRKIFREAFEAAGLPYFNPHSLRNTLAHLAETVCKTPEDFKAWSQNLGHEQVLTTFRSYGQVSGSRQGEIILNIGDPRRTMPSDTSALAKEIVREMRKQRD